MSESRTRQKRLKHLEAAVRAADECDARFFNTHPGRAYRLRLASQEEQEFNAVVAGALPLDRDCVLFAGVRQVSPFRRERRFVQARPGLDCAAVGDEFARNAFNKMAIGPIEILELNYEAGFGSGAVH